MTLYIYTTNFDLRGKLFETVDNRRITDSGFDIPMSESIIDYSCPIHIFDLEIVVAATDASGNPTPCLLIPRSSLSSSPFRLGNSIGLIDSGYRGKVKAKVDVLSDIELPFPIQEGTRYFQICQHNFLPWNHVTIVQFPEDLPVPLDNRGAGGFGSTGQ